KAPVLGLPRIGAERDGAVADLAHFVGTAARREGGTAGVVCRKRNERGGVVVQVPSRLLAYLIAPLRPWSYIVLEGRVIEVEGRHGRPRRGSLSGPAQTSV